jgi:hypothetical protein
VPIASSAAATALRLTGAAASTDPPPINHEALTYAHATAVVRGCAFPLSPKLSPALLQQVGALWQMLLAHTGEFQPCLSFTPLCCIVFCTNCVSLLTGSPLTTQSLPGDGLTLGVKVLILCSQTCAMPLLARGQLADTVCSWAYDGLHY